MDEKQFIPSQALSQIAKAEGVDVYSEEFARAMDRRDPLAKFRQRFTIPRAEPHSTECPEALYFAGNSLGLMPKSTRKYLDEELDKWQMQAVEGHFNGTRPWARIDELVTGMMAGVVGAQESEVAVMNTLSVNLHLLMISFYQPSKTRFKILIEADAFCSDHHVVRSQIEYHKLNIDSSLIELKPRAGEMTLRIEDILRTIEQEGSSIALILLGGVQFYTGQAFDMKVITDAGHKQGCVVAFDLAHAVGNIPLRLHEWGVDWAAWCTYKYLNSGPGAIGGIFVHERHATTPNSQLPRLRGWWGQNLSDRFKMTSQHAMKAGAQAFQMSNPTVLSTVCLQSALEVYTEATPVAQRTKSMHLTGYLEMLLAHELGDFYKQVTPADPSSRGCQLSLLMKHPAGVKAIDKQLAKRGVICDVREPNVLRVSPNPLYNQYLDVFRFVQHLKAVLTSLKPAKL